MKNKLLLLLGTALAVNAQAIEIENGTMKLDVKGGMDFQFGMYSDTPKESSLGIAKTRKNNMFYTTAHAEIKASKKTDNGIEYGAQIALDVTSKNARKAPSSIFLISDVGKIEFGTDKSVYSIMRISGTSMLVATGGMWDMYPTFAPQETDLFVSSTTNYLEKTRLLEHIEYSRKINYTTPWLFEHLQVGVSYIHDSQNAGITSISDFIAHTPAVSGVPIQVSKAWAGGITYKLENDIFKFKSSVVFETGKVKVQDAKGNKSLPEAYDLSVGNLHDLKGYTVGAQFEWQGIGIAASYGNYGRSLLPKVYDVYVTSVYTAGVKYNFPNKVSVGVAGLASTHTDNHLKAITLSTEYALSDHIKPYAEVTKFYTKAKNYVADNGLLMSHGEKTYNRQGTVGIVGIKMEF